MKKILCPVDFSNASKNGVEFAGNLAAHLMAHVTLMYVRPTIWPEAVQLRAESSQSAAEIVDDLKTLSDEVEKEFGVTCGVHLERTMDPVEKSIAEYGGGYDLIVTGTNGADDTYQLVFGSHSYQVIQQAMCPVLLIPENVKYKPLKQLVYAYDPHTNPIFLVDQLRDFANAVGATVRVVHVVEDEKTQENEARIEHLRQAVMARAYKDNPWEFEGLYGRDVAWTLERYASAHPVDVMALSYHHRTLMDKVFHQNVIKQISMTADFPVFTFWK
jgi:nucleotide-binding universal stress UspA family protein